MPELPEVEIIRRGLLPRLIGLQIAAAEVSAARIFRTEPTILTRRLPGQFVEGLIRRGKFLLFQLDRDVLIVHLGMTGQLTLRDPHQPDASGFLRNPATGLQRIRQHPPDRHTHLQIRFSDDRVLMLRDPRMFGRVLLSPREAPDTEQMLAMLGREPLSDQFQLDWFLEQLRRHPKVKIKSLLLDQRIIAGLGNIYADEALFEAGIRPSRRVRYLRRAERERLFESIPRVLEKGIRYGGTSLRDYINSDGESGENQEKLSVYGRAGQPCPRCGLPIVKTVVAQRGTHYCRSCQKP